MATRRLPSAPAARAVSSMASLPRPSSSNMPATSAAESMAARYSGRPAASAAAGTISATSCVTADSFRSRSVASLAVPRHAAMRMPSIFCQPAGVPFGPERGLREPHGLPALLVQCAAGRRTSRRRCGSRASGARPPPARRPRSPARTPRRPTDRASRGRRSPRGPASGSRQTARGPPRPCGPRPRPTSTGGVPSAATQALRAAAASA